MRLLLAVFYVIIGANSAQILQLVQHAILTHTIDVSTQQFRLFAHVLTLTMMTDPTQPAYLAISSV